MKSFIAAILLAILPVSGIVPLAAQLSYAVEADQDTSLQSFKADGVAVVDGQTINLPQGTSTILIEASTTELFAEAITSANSDNLQPGSNTVTVTVTAADGVTQQVYSLFVVVAAPSSDTTLSEVLVNGEIFTGALDGTGVFQAPVGTTQVTVAATATSQSAQVAVTGNTNLVTGSGNTVAIQVTSEDGTTTGYSFKVNVATPNTNTDLSSFLINGSSVSDNDIVNVPYGTTDVSVSAVTASGTSTYSYTGNTGLTTGDHTVTVTVTSQANTSATHSVVIRVAAVSTDRTIDSIKVNGTEIVSNNAYVASGVTSVDVLATLHSGFSTYTVSGNTGLNPGANTVTITVTSQDGVSENRVITVNVYIPSNDSSLGSLSVDGNLIAVGDTVNVVAYVSSVTVEAIATDANATVVVTGNTDLATGANLVTITVTAEDGSQTSYTFTVQVALSTNTDVTSISIAGVDRTAGNSAVQNTAKLATSVAVLVVTADESSTFTVTGNTDLHLGANTVIVTVTAPSGGFATYERDIFVPGLSSNTGLTSITVDGATVAEGGTLPIAHGVTSVSVLAVTADEFAIYEVLGDTNLVTGSNTVSLKVTAEDGTIASYSFTVQVALSGNTGITSITIEGVDRTSATSAVQDTAKLATAVSVVVVTTDPDATYAVSGNDPLSTGVNEITISVSAPDDSIGIYKRSVNVPGLSSNAALSTITVDGELVAVDGSVSKIYGTTSVDVVADPADAFATYAVTGTTGLVSGSNTVTVAVTAEDGSVVSYTVTVNVAGSSEVGVSSISVDGVDVTVSGVFTTLVGATSVAVSVVTVDADAGVVVSGASALQAGPNVVNVRVTAADGVSFADYPLTVTVPVLSSNKALSVFTVDGVTVVDGGSVSKVYGTTDVVVVATAEDVNADVVVSGGSALVSGPNTVTVAVTAEDGSVVSYTVTVNVAGSSEVGVSSISVDGVDVTVSGVFTTLVGATSVAVSVVTVDADAGVVVSGASALQAGPNVVNVRVTAADGVSFADYPLTVTVPVLSSNKALSVFTVDGVTVVDGGSVSKVYGTTDVVVVATAEDVNADVVVSGGSALVSGSNTVTVAVTAEDGSVVSYTVTVNVAGSSEVGVSSISVDGVDVTVSGVFTTLVGATSVAVSVVTVDADAGVVVSGASALQAGPNVVNVRVTAADGVSFADYPLTVTVPVLSSNKALSVFTVDGVTVVDGGSVSKVYGTTDVVVVATAEDVNADVVVSGGSALVSGSNTVTVAVTAEDGSVVSYTVTVNVAGSSEVGVSSISVDGEVVVVGGSVVRPYLTSSVVVVGVPVDVDAQVSVSGVSGLHVGSNAVTVRVTAADGVSFADYVVYVSVTAADINADLAVFSVNGVNVLDGSQVDVGSDVSSVVVVAEASSDLASFEVSGASGLVTGSNFVRVTVTAQDGSTRVYSATVVKARPLSSDKSLASISVNGSLVAVNGVVDVVYGTSSVTVAAVAADVNASTQVFGASGLQVGLNTVSVVVTAEDQSTLSYVFKVRVARSNNTDLLSVSVAGAAVSLTSLAVTVAPNVSSVVVSAVPVDAEAGVAVSGGSVLSFGLNTVLVTVTAADGVASRVYEVSVTRTAYSSDKRLASLRVNGVVTEVDSVVRVEPGVSSVSVVASVVDADASAVVLGASGLVPGNNAVIVRVTAADGSVLDYGFTVYVRPVSVDTSLKLFTVNGEAVVDGAVVVLDGSADFVTVVAQANDVNASAVVSGSTGLQFGLNTVSVTVTAESGAVEDHLVQVLYPDVADATLKTFTVDGVSVEDGSVVELGEGVTDVVVVAESTYGGEVVVDGGVDLQPGENTLTVTVTSLDGANSVDYVVTLNVALSSNTDLSVFTVNGVTASDGAVINIDPYTVEVEVTVEVAYEGATFEIEGGTELAPGPNTLTVTVTAANGETTRAYTVTLNVELGSDVELAVFQIEGEDATAGETYTFPYGTEAVEITAEPVRESTTVTISGADTLHTGRNVVKVLATAEDGNYFTYRLIVIVSENTDTSLESFTVGGQDAMEGAVTLPAGTRAAVVSVVTTDPYATFTVDGGSELVAGENTVTVTVVAADGETTADYVVTVTVEEVVLGTDTSLESVTVGGLDAMEGAVTLPAGTRAAVVSVVTTDPYATFTVDGGSELVAGENTVTVTVVAADGETTADYVVTVTVEEVVLGTDTSLESVTVGGLDAMEGAVTLPAGTRAAVVSVVTTDPYATFTVDGGSELVAGENTVIVTVVAADGETSADFEITVTVEGSVAGTDTGVNFITVAGQDGLAGPVNVGSGTRAVRVIVETTDPFASFAVDGNVDLQPGENTVTVTVTAADGETTEDYSITVLIPELSDDTSFSLFKINGLEVGDGDSIDLASGTSHVNVKFTTTDDYATYMIAGDGNKIGSPLQEGENSLVVTVTAQNGDSTDYTVTLNVLVLSTNSDLAEEEPVTINGEAIDPAILDDANGYFDLPLTATRISVGVKAADPGADVFVNDKTVWPTIARSFSVEKGVNLISIEVVPPAGTGFARTYTLKVYVGGADATLKTVKVNTTAITFNEEYAGTLPGLLANGTVKAALFVEPTVALKSGNSAGTQLAFDGGDATVTKTATANTYSIDGLVTGENVITIEVTPGDANMDPYTYTVTINVALSSDKAINSFLINGAAVTVGSTLILPKGTESAELDAVLHSELATFEASGADSLVPGINTAVITVTAEDESTQEYKVTILVPAAVDVIVVGFPKVGVLTVDAKTNAAGNKAIADEIKKIGKGTVIKVEITNNFLIAKDKPTAGPARAVAVQKYLQAQKINGIKTAIYAFTVGAKSQKGTTVTIYRY